MLWLMILLVVVLQGTVSFKVSCPHMADRLQGIDGCFKWSWDDHDVLTLLPEYDSSNHRSTSYSGRKETSVYASDIPVGIGKVLVENLSGIQILHTRVKLDLDGIAILHVQNDFDKEAFASNHLVYVPLKYSPLSDCGVQINLQDIGVYTNLYLLKEIGIGVGHQVVYVHLRWKDKIVLIAAEAMSLHSRTNMVSIDTHLYPQNPVLRIGSGLNFSIQGLNYQVSGRWFSGNTSILSVCMSSGTAVAMRQGVTQVFFESSRLKLQTTVRVVMEDICIDAPKEMLTNVPFPGREYKFYVKLSDSYYGKVDGALGNYKGVSFDCRVEPRNVGNVVPCIDRDTGDFYCLFFPYSPELMISLVPRPNDVNPIRSVSITASLTEANQVSGRACARFTGGFSILGSNGQETMMLNLSPDFNTTFITLVGNTDVQIHKRRWVFFFETYGESMINVSLISKEDFGIGGRMVYEVKALTNFGFREKIIVALAANGQRMEIDVNFRPAPESPIVVPVLILIIMVGFIYYVKSMQYAYTQALSASQALLG